MALESKITGVVYAILGVILVLLLVGNAGMVAIINSSLTGICNSGWPLASVFNPTDGIVPLLIIVGLLLATIAGAMAIGKSAKGGK
jgi:hypothetical protein